MDREKQSPLTCEQLCFQRGVFYRPLPNVEHLDAELLKLKRLASLKRGEKGRVAIHVAMLREGKGHFGVIESFLKYGKLGSLETRSVSNYFNSYVKSAITEDIQDIIVVMVTDEEEIEWSAPDRNGRRSGFPKIHYDRKKYGEPPIHISEEKITHVPPDRIIGFYFIKYIGE